MRCESTIFSWGVAAGTTECDCRYRINRLIFMFFLCSAWIFAGSFTSRSETGAVPGAKTAIATGAARVRGLQAVARSGVTCVEIVSSAHLAATVYAVGNPARIVVDAPAATFLLDREVSGQRIGLVERVRYGELPGGAVRVVIDVAPGTELGVVRSAKLSGDHFLLSIGLGVSAGEQVDGHLTSDACNGATVAVAQGRGAAGQQPVTAMSTAGKPGIPVVVIDPGHGGVDPGAVVNSDILEKVIVFAVAERLEKKLRDTFRFRVVMTRTGDTFVSLDERVERSRLEKGDLFVSLHADSIDNAVGAAAVRGAAVYVLSLQASDAEARRLAEKENAADRLAGVIPKRAVEQEGVRTILVDLLKRETERESERFQALLVASMTSLVPVARQPLRSAAFHVLKQTETPAALVELGYMTNPHDLRLMRQAEWQEKMAGAIAKSIEKFFDERSVR